MARSDGIIDPGGCRRSWIACQEDDGGETGLTEPMEPLWHAIRAELGEELEPLPVEIMETVTDLRQEFSDMNRSGKPGDSTR